MMLSAQDRRAKLEKLLARVKQNRGYLDEDRASKASEEQEYEELPLPSEPAPIDVDSVHATTAEILGAQQTESIGQGLAETEKEEEILEAEPVVEPEEEEVYVPDLSDEIIEEEHKPGIPAPELEVRRFEAKPSASGDVSVQKGAGPKEWTLGAVLERAWKLGE
jgi:hypothetical protein